MDQTPVRLSSLLIELLGISMPTLVPGVELSRRDKRVFAMRKADIANA